MAFKIALDAGHGKYTAGKRCLKSLDKNETREWVLNNRIADKVEVLLRDYDGYDLLRVDDTTGEKDVSLSKRVKAANDFNADLYLSIHANAGIKGGKGGGIISIAYLKVSVKTVEYQKLFYDNLIEKTGLVGNRSDPLPKQNLHVLRETKMPAILLELGYMDSATDVPIILSEDFADKSAEAIVESLVEIGQLSRKTNALYRVQVGAYVRKSNATAMLNKLKAAGFEAYITLNR